MKYVIISTKLPNLKWSQPHPIDKYTEAYIRLGKYVYIFSKQLYPSRRKIDCTWLSKKDFYKRAINVTSNTNDITSNLDLIGIRLDVGITEDTEPPDLKGNDVGDQPLYMTVMKLIYQELENIAKTGKNLWIINDLNDSFKREIIYDRFGKKLSYKYNYDMYKFTWYDRSMRLLKKL